jgi:hypothetical protein
MSRSRIISIVPFLSIVLSLTACDGDPTAAEAPDNLTLPLAKPVAPNPDAVVSAGLVDQTVRDIVEGRAPMPMFSKVYAEPHDVSCPQQREDFEQRPDAVPQFVSIDDDDEQLLATPLSATCILVTPEFQDLVICDEYVESMLPLGAELVPLAQLPAGATEISSGPTAGIGVCWFCANQWPYCDWGATRSKHIGVVTDWGCLGQFFGECC